MSDYVKAAAAALARCDAAASSGVRKAFDLGVATERKRCAELVRSYRLKIVSTVTGRAEEHGIEALAKLLEVSP